MPKLDSPETSIFDISDQRIPLLEEMSLITECMFLFLFVFFCLFVFFTNQANVNDSLEVVTD